MKPSCANFEAELNQEHNSNHAIYGTHLEDLGDQGKLVD